MDSNQFQSREKKQERLIAVLLFLVFVLGGLLLVEKFSPGFSVWGSRQEAFVENAQERLDSISEQLQVRMVQIKKLGGRVNELEVARQQILGDQKALADHPEMTQQEIEKKLAYYLRLITQKDVEIRKLRREKVVLVARNDSLSVGA